MLSWGVCERTPRRTLRGRGNAAAQRAGFSSISTRTDEEYRERVARNETFRRMRTVTIECGDAEMKRRSARLPSRRCPCGLVAIVCAVALFLEGGCSSQWVNYEQIRASRADAYQQWRWAHDRGEKSKALVRGGLSLEDALKLALTYSKPLQVVVEQKAVARGRILESYSEALPTLSAVGNYTRLDEVSSFDVGGESISLGYLDNYSVELQVRQPVFRGGSGPEHHLCSSKRLLSGSSCTTPVRGE